MSSRLFKLRAPEVLLLRRALMTYLRFFQDQIPAARDDAERADLKQRIGAIETLHHRLLKGD